MSASRSARSRRALRPFAAIATALAAAVLLAAPAAAHDTITGTSPEDGATLTEVPSEIALTFSSEPLEVSPEVVVTDESGAVVTDTTPTVDGFDVLQPLPEDLTSGTYDVAWRVVSSDGHPIDGSFSFDLDVPEVEGTTDESAEATTEADDAATSDAEATETDTASASITAVDGEDGSDDGTPWGLIAGAAGLVALIVAVVVLAVRRARDPNGPAGQH
ncbi:hypothetical protein SAMN04489860_0150 [Paraoerskovia marina]|uniref:CopC domain-containing protein n=1 Tax=Paraoerskovia marina TaxID=545619 RepID=A0A1H1M6I7_9CELL|nr:copper resistance CopC family protein [Paraoerskovia marina]SDR82270.1 hypothetical protein SAMN04489860_0150 [Paraoerskovia marina]